MEFCLVSRILVVFIQTKTELNLKMKERKENFLMNFAFFTKFLSDVRNQAQVLLKRSCTLDELVNTQREINCYV